MAKELAPEPVCEGVQKAALRVVQGGSEHIANGVPRMFRGGGPSTTYYLAKDGNKRSQEKDKRMRTSDPVYVTLEHQATLTSDLTDTV